MSLNNLSCVRPGWETCSASRSQLIMFMPQLNRNPITSQVFINGWQWMNEQWGSVLAGQPLCNCSILIYRAGNWILALHKLLFKAPQLILFLVFLSCILRCPVFWLIPDVVHITWPFLSQNKVYFRVFASCFVRDVLNSTERYFND